MKRSLLLVTCVALIAALGTTRAGLRAQDNSDKSKADEYKISDADVARVNPVKSSRKSLSSSRTWTLQLQGLTSSSASSRNSRRHSLGFVFP